MKPGGTNSSTMRDADLLKMKKSPSGGGLGGSGGGNSKTSKAKSRELVSQLTAITNPDTLKASINLLSQELHKTNSDIERQSLRMALAPKVKTFDKRTKA